MFVLFVMQSYLIEVRGLKQVIGIDTTDWDVVSYRGTWIETAYLYGIIIAVIGRIL